MATDEELTETDPSCPDCGEPLDEDGQCTDCESEAEREGVRNDDSNDTTG